MHCRKINFYTVYFSVPTNFTKKLIEIPLEGKGTFTFSYTVTTRDWETYGPNSVSIPELGSWTGIPFINTDNSLKFLMDTIERGEDTVVSITVTSVGTKSPLTGLNFHGNGTSEIINETIKGNLSKFTKIVITDFGGAFLSRNRKGTSSSQIFGQFENLPTLSYEGNAETMGPLILTGTSLRDCFAFCNNFNENC